MGANDNGHSGGGASPFTDAWPTPDVQGTGLNGLGAGLDSDTGPQGIINTPFDKAQIPLSISTAPTGGGELPVPPATISLTDAPSKGSQAPWDVTSSRNTVDKR